MTTSPDPVLEIITHPLSSRWVRVSPGIFRSWGGRRRIDGAPYAGPVFVLDTDRQVAR